MKKLFLWLIIMISLSACDENIYPNSTPFVVRSITHVSATQSCYCKYESDYYLTEIVDSCNKYKIGDTIKFTK